MQSISDNIRRQLALLVWVRCNSLNIKCDTYAWTETFETQIGWNFEDGISDVEYRQCNTRHREPYLAYIWTSVCVSVIVTPRLTCIDAE